MMKQRLTTIFFSGLLFFLPATIFCQSVADVLPGFRNAPRYILLCRFYQLNGNRPVWIGNDRLQQEFLHMLQQAPSVGLNTAEYSADLLHNEVFEHRLPARTDSLEAEVRWTAAALHFFMDLYAGSRVPDFRFAGLRYTPQQTFPLQWVNEQLQQGRLDELFSKLQPKGNVYAGALQLLARLQRTAAAPDFSERRIVSTKADSTNSQLLLRLRQFGFLDSLERRITKKELVQKIRLAQQLFDLLDDGVLRSTTLEAFNKPLALRIEELKSLLNTLRWLEPIRQTAQVLVLNLPSASFFLYEKGTLQLFSKLIVGKPSTPTPTLTSTITEVVLYPYWMVPHKIATRELLPAIKKNIGYLERGNYQVLNKQGQVLDPYRIPWHSLSRGYFPYLIRQSTGCDNSLGIVKFNFENPFAVYLHDTPVKLLFASTRRFYSHGCMRVEKPVELARYVLGFNRIAIDTLSAKGCLDHQAPLSVPVQKQLPVIVLYSTAWYNESGQLRFYEDVYGRNKTVAVRAVAFLPETQPGLTSVRPEADGEDGFRGGERATLPTVLVHH